MKTRVRYGYMRFVSVNKTGSRTENVPRDLSLKFFCFFVVNFT